ncbi:MAG: AMP-binding protein [Pseudomonadota bacterium]
MPRDGNLVRLLHRRVAEAPRQPLYVFLDRRGAVQRTLTRESLYFAACRLAVRLQAAALQQRPVVLYYPHGPAFPIAFWAAILAGAIPVPVARPHSSRRECRERSGDATMAVIPDGCDAAAVLTTATRAQVLDTASAIPVLATDIDVDHNGRWRQPDPDSGDPAFIQYSSGSTGTPRGVVVTHGNILHNSEQIRRAFSIRADDTGVCWLPLHHDMGLIGHVIQPLYSGIRNVFLAPGTFAARPLRWLRAISEHGGTISGGPDSAFAACCNQGHADAVSGLDLSRWRLAYCGAERVCPLTLRRFVARFRAAGFEQRALYPCYGLAESTLFVSGRHGLQTTSEGPDGPERVSCGAPIPGTRIAVMACDSGAIRPDGQLGEIVVRSGSVADGYHGEPNATRQRFSQTGKGGVVLLRTGDFGFLREGELYVSGRADHCLQHHGRNVFAEDLEAAIEAAALPGILRSAAFTVDLPEREDETSLVIVMEHDGRTESRRLWQSREEVPGVLAMATGIVPHDVVVWPRGRIPLTTSGKIRRNHCRERYLSAVGRGAQRY